MRLIIRCLASLWRHYGRSKCTLCILEVQTKTIKNIRRKNIFSSWRKIIFHFWKFWKFWKFSKKTYNFENQEKNQLFKNRKFRIFVLTFLFFSIFEKKIWFSKFWKFRFFQKSKIIFLQDEKIFFVRIFFYDQVRTSATQGKSLARPWCLLGDAARPNPCLVSLHFTKFYKDHSDLAGRLGPSWRSASK